MINPGGSSHLIPFIPLANTALTSEDYVTKPNPEGHFVLAFVRWVSVSISACQLALSSEDRSSIPCQRDLLF